MKIVCRKGRHIFAQSVFLVCMLIAFGSSAFGLDPSLDINQYAHNSWKIRDGFTKSRIQTIAQTPDGYLWLGTEFGLLSFDGVKVVPWKPPTDQQLPSNTIFKLLGARDGTLWIATDKGLAKWDGKRVTQYPEFAGQFVFALLEDRDGVVWAGSYSFEAPPTGKLCAIHAGSIQCHGANGSLGRGVLSLYQDKRGNLWASGQNGVWRWKPGPTEFFPVPGISHGKEIFGEDLDGTLLVVAESGIKRLVNGKPEEYRVPGAVGQFRAKSLFSDRDGSLWIGTSNSGIVHVHHNRTDVFSSSDGLSGESVNTFFEDRENNIWVTTQSGLDRFHEVAIPTFTVRQGLSNGNVESVLAAKDGNVLIATVGGLNRWNNGQIEIYGDSNLQSRQIANHSQSLFQDSQGRIWVVTLREFGYLENGRTTPISNIPGGVVRSMAEGTEGMLWIANQDFGLFQLQSGKLVQQIPWQGLGHKDFASSLASDSLHGGIWLGFFQGGIVHFRDGKVQASYGANDGLGAGRVNGIWLNQDGTLWAATEGGLSLLKNNRFATLTTNNGLPCNTIHWMIEGDDNAFWLYTSCGLVRIARTELNAWLSAVDENRDAKFAVQTTIFDSSDGVTITMYSTGLTPQVAKSRDGKLWFPSVDGISVVDPFHLSLNRLPPPVHIEQISADHKTYDLPPGANGQIRIPPLGRDLEIDYTALSLVAPEKVMFRYMLEGYDHDWQEAGTRRQAFYTNLPPRNYRFRVIACNNSGVWNEVGASLDFSIAPTYYQTTWFRVSGVAAFFVLVVGLYQLRVRHVAKRLKGQMKARIEERERIARELHDTLLQSIQGLILKFHVVAKHMARDDAAGDALNKALDQADVILAEGRDRVRNLRDSASPGDLSAAFCRLVDDSYYDSKVRIETVVEGNVRELNAMVQEECYAIGREALLNALTHSGGLHIEVEITYDFRKFRLRIRDDGRGIDPGILGKGGRTDHWGLQGMRERARRIGARLDLWSRPGMGTEVELIVPAATAYQSLRVKSRNSWFRRTSGAD